MRYVVHTTHAPLLSPKVQEANLVCVCVCVPTSVLLCVLSCVCVFFCVRQSARSLFPSQLTCLSFRLTTVVVSHCRFIGADKLWSARDDIAFRNCMLSVWRWHDFWAFARRKASLASNVFPFAGELQARKKIKGCACAHIHT